MEVLTASPCTLSPINRTIDLRSIYYFTCKNMAAGITVQWRDSSQYITGIFACRRLRTDLSTFNWHCNVLSYLLSLIVYHNFAFLFVDFFFSLILFVAWWTEEFENKALFLLSRIIEMPFDVMIVVIDGENYWSLHYYCKIKVFVHLGCLDLSY